MQPLRKDHVDHYKDFVRDEFSLASNRVEREISQQAQDKVEEVGDKFAQVINKNLPSLIKDMQKKEKALIDFQQKKHSVENDLRYQAQKIADQITEIFNNTIKRNKWEKQQINIDIHEDKDAVD